MKDGNYKTSITLLSEIMKCNNFSKDTKFNKKSQNLTKNQKRLDE